MTVNLLDFDGEGLTAWFAQQGEKPFRADQVMKWMYHYCSDNFDDMTDINKVLRNKLKEYSEAGVAVPATMDEFVKAVAAVSGKNSAGQTVWGLNEPALAGWNVLPYIWSNGGDTPSTNGRVSSTSPIPVNR